MVPLIKSISLINILNDILQNRHRLLLFHVLFAPKSDENQSGELKEARSHLTAAVVILKTSTETCVHVLLFAS